MSSDIPTQPLTSREALAERGRVVPAAWSDADCDYSLARLIQRELEVCVTEAVAASDAALAALRAATCEGARNIGRRHGESTSTVQQRIYRATGHTTGRYRGGARKPSLVTTSDTDAAAS